MRASNLKISSSSGSGTQTSYNNHIPAATPAPTEAINPKAPAFTLNAPLPELPVVLAEVAALAPEEAPEEAPEAALAAAPVTWLRIEEASEANDPVKVAVKDEINGSYYDIC